MGVNVNRVISFTFVLGSVLAAAAGVLVAISKPKIDPLMGLLPGLKAFIAAVLGGIGNVTGAVVGGLLLGLIEARWWDIFPRDRISEWRGVCDSDCDIAGEAIGVDGAERDGESLMVGAGDFIHRMPRRVWRGSPLPMSRERSWVLSAAKNAWVPILIFATGGRGGVWSLRIEPGAYVMHVATLAAINIILAVSLQLINGVSGQFSLGHAGFMAVGAYLARVWDADVWAAGF